MNSKRNSTILITLILLCLLTGFIYFFEQYTFQVNENRLKQETAYLAESLWNMDRENLRLSLVKILDIEGANRATIVHKNGKKFITVRNSEKYFGTLEDLLRDLSLIRLTNYNVPVYYHRELLGYMQTRLVNRNFYVYLYISSLLALLEIIILYHLDYRERENKYRELVENANSAIVRWDKQGKIIFFNEYAEKFFGYQQEEILGKPLLGTIVPEKDSNGQELQKVIDQINNSPDKLNSVIIEGQRKDGTRVWFNWTHKKVKNALTRETNIFSVGSDITSQKQAEDKLKAARKELVDTARLAGKAEVASNVLHNVGNVLTSINTIVNLLKNQKYKLNLENYHKAIQMLTDHHDDLAVFLTEDPKGKLIPDYLLNFSQHIEREQNDVKTLLEDLTKHVQTVTNIISIQQTFAHPGTMTEITNISEVANDALKVDLPNIEKNNINVIREYEPIPSFYVDRHLLLQILHNLIRNSLESLKICRRKDKELIIRIYGSDSRAVIEIQDNGIGIPEENNDKIFTYGFSTKKGGHGFGLHGSANLAKTMKGSLLFHSDGVNKGATFRLLLPVNREMKES